MRWTVDVNTGRLNINGLQHNSAMTTAVVSAQGLKVKCVWSEKAFSCFFNPFKEEFYFSSALFSF